MSRFHWGLCISIIIHIVAFWGNPVQEAPQFNVDTSKKIVQHMSVKLYTPPKPQESKKIIETPKQKTPVKQPVEKQIANNPKPTPEKRTTAQKTSPDPQKEIAQAEVQADVLPHLLQNPKPPYPKAAKRNGYEGTVVLMIHVLKSGEVGAIKVSQSSGYNSLDESAVDTLKQWTFSPAKKGNTPIDIWVQIPVEFKIQSS